MQLLPRGSAKGTNQRGRPPETPSECGRAPALKMEVCVRRRIVAQAEEAVRLLPEATGDDGLQCRVGWCEHWLYECKQQGKCEERTVPERGQHRPHGDAIPGPAPIPAGYSSLVPPVSLAVTQGPIGNPGCTGWGIASWLETPCIKPAVLRGAGFE